MPTLLQTNKDDVIFEWDQQCLKALKSISLPYLASRLANLVKEKPLVLYIAP